jgi:hypothetical protein
MASPDGSKLAMRHRIEWAHTAFGFDRPATLRTGDLTLVSTLRLEAGQIIEHVVGFSTFTLPQLLLLDWRLDVVDVPDPMPEQLGAVPGDPSTSPEDHTLAERFVRAFGANDTERLAELYDPDIELYTPLGWPVQGWAAVGDFVSAFHASNPGMRVGLHDQFPDATGTCACWRIRLHFHNTASFFGNPPTGDQGEMMETHLVHLRDGRIHRQFVGDCGFQLPKGELVDWQMDFPRDPPDPDPPLGPAALAPTAP